uniref:Uncharacterized protein n=1 Tax=Onchocerca volvulus TaxID=6282 RepID=A0A8R1TTY8_ONCVO
MNSRSSDALGYEHHEIEWLSRQVDRWKRQHSFPLTHRVKIHVMRRPLLSYLRASRIYPPTLIFVTATR